MLLITAGISGLTFQSDTHKHIASAMGIKGGLHGWGQVAVATLRCPFTQAKCNEIHCVLLIFGRLV